MASKCFPKKKVVPSDIDEEVTAVLERLDVEFSPAGLRKYSKAQRSVVDRQLNLPRAVITTSALDHPRIMAAHEELPDKELFPEMDKAKQSSSGLGNYTTREQHG